MGTNCTLGRFPALWGEGRYWEMSVSINRVVRTLYGEVPAENLPMLDLVKRMGFNLHGPEEGTCRVELDPASWTAADYEDA